MGKVLAAGSNPSPRLHLGSLVELHYGAAATRTGTGLSTTPLLPSCPSVP